MRTTANVWLLILLIFSLLSSSASADIKVSTSGGMEKIASFNVDEMVYLCLSEMNRFLGGSMDWEQPGYSVKYTLDASRFLFRVGSPIVDLNDSLLNIIYPARIVDGALYVPAPTYIPLLNLARPENITWDDENRTVRIDAEWFNVTDLTIVPKQNGILIEIFMTKALDFEVYESEGNWLNFDFPKARINRDKIMGGVDRRYIYKINAFQFENSAQISLRMKRPFKKFHSNFKSDPIRLQIAIEDESFQVSDSALASLNRIGPDEKIDVIVIDAGHGGRDYGAIGRSKGTREKDVNLEIAKILAKLIRKDKQFKVVMTRSKDEYVSLDRRAEIANQARADLFVSIHANAAPKRSAHGFEIFYLAPAKSDAARAVAQFENAPFLLEDPAFEGGEGDDLAFILNDMIQTEFLTESADLAYMCDMEMRRKIKISPRGVDHAGFFVLNRVYMPSILVETAFISNDDEEKMLRKKSFREDIAEGIYEAIKRFKDKYDKK